MSVKTTIGIFLLIYCLSWSKAVCAHDIRLAFFELKESQTGEYSLSVSFDKEDLAQAIPVTIGLTDSHKRRILHYLNENFQLSLNDQCVGTSLISISEEADFVRLQFKVENFKEKIKSIRIFNTCLIEEIEGHSNIFKALINGKSRSFRLTESRITTEFEY